MWNGPEENTSVAGELYPVRIAAILAHPIIMKDIPNAKSCLWCTKRVRRFTCCVLCGEYFCNLVCFDEFHARRRFPGDAGYDGIVQKGKKRDLATATASTGADSATSTTPITPVPFPSLATEDVESQSSQADLLESSQHSQSSQTSHPNQSKSKRTRRGV